MPLYEYECKACGHRFEHFARSLSEKTPKCPGCGAADPKKLLSAFSTDGGSKTVSSSGSCPTGSCPLS